MNKLLADISFAPSSGTFGCIGNSKLCSNFNPNAAGTVLNSLLSTIIGVMTVIAFIWFTIQVFIGALGIIGAGGDKAKVAEARAKISSGLVGVVVVIAAIFIIRLIGLVLGLDILNPGSFISNLTL